MSDTILKYRTFDELLDEVATDFHVYNLEGMIEPAQLFKVVLKINKELGLKINQTRHTILEVDHRKAKLPNDFYVANMALLCGKFTTTAPVLSGRHTENIQIDTRADGISPVVEIVSDCAGGDCSQYQVIEKVQYETRTFTELVPLKLTSSPLINADIQNLLLNSSNSRWLGYNNENTGRQHPVQGDYHTAQLSNGYIRTLFDCGRIFLSYEGAMVDEDDNLLCLDHDIINEYYEYALKLRILENLYMNGEDTAVKIKFIEQERLKPARTNALSIAYTPDFAELKSTYEMNRKAMHKRYYNIFR